MLSKVSAVTKPPVKAAYWQIFDTGDLGEEAEPGQDLVERVQRRIDAFADAWSHQYPAAVKSPLTDRAALTTHLRFPAQHHKRIRHSTFIERTLGETPPRQGDRPPARRDLACVPGVGHA
ncbi:hypothetical protein TBS_18690 [Thermobispora bispora]